MAFDAAATVQALDYDFRPFLEVHGTTPEPSDRAVRHFLYESQQLIAELPDSSDEDFVERMKTMTEEDWDAISDRVIDQVAELTQGYPTRDEIASLPHRIQRAYITWLRKELTDPEAPSAATKGSVVALKRGAPITQRAGS